MQRRSLLFFLLLPCFLPLKAQYNQWVWMAGDSAANQAGAYGTQGVASPANRPGARYEGAEWVDLQGNFWHFGGRVNNLFTNDLWKFDPITNQWTWMKGPNTTGQSGIYGTLGVAAAANNPGARAYASVSWVDQQGRFWLFGGYGYNAGTTVGYLNDLWRYDPITNMWTWVSGTSGINQPGVYGTKGIAAAGNRPGGREETSASWVDANGKLWMYGGFGLGFNLQQGFLNDLWMYDPVTLRWTWISGDNTVNQADVWGTKGVSATTNKPGGRSSYASSRDNNGNMWMFGGGIAGVNCDDLWKYDMGNNQWTWMKGSTNGSAGSFGAQCVEDTLNNPPALYEQRSRWTDDCGNMWVFGGFSVSEYSNNLFRYSVKNNNWTWVSGANTMNQAGNYGVQGQASATNVPGARGGSLPFRRPGQNELWLFGGGGGADRNDMWKFIPDKPTAGFTSTAGTCPLSFSFTNTSIPGCNEIRSWSWDFGDPASGAANTSVQLNPTHTFSGGGNFNVKLRVINCTGSSDSIIKVVNVSTSQKITLTIKDAACPGDTSGSVSAVVTGGTGPYTYSWSNGQSSASISGLGMGNYSVTVIDSNGCSVTLPASVNQKIGPTAGAGNDTTILAGITVTLKGSGGGTYTWSPAEGLSCTDCPNPLAKPSVTTTYTLTVSDSSGCTATDQVTIFVDPQCDKGVFVPNAFSPNGDGKNDVLFVYANCLKTFTFMVFDRWGEKVFESTETKKGWDGTFSGKEFSTAIFVYTLKGMTTDDKEVIKSGTVSLMR